MPYEGERVFCCYGMGLQWSLTYAIVVNGARWNPCGHSLINVGGCLGYYFHIAGDGYDPPHSMDERGYQRYLRENKKKEIYRQWVPIANPEDAQKKFEELLSKDWLWLVLPNNCTTFVEIIFQAGGTPFGVTSNCPAIEGWR